MLLRVILYPILFVSILWVAAILIGPKILQTMLKHYSNEKVFVDGLTVKKDLSLTARNILYVKEHSGIEQNETFNFRAIGLSWRLKNWRPIFKLSVGPSKLGSFGNFESASIDFLPDKFLFGSDLEFIGEISNTNFYSRADFKSGKFEGKISSSWTSLKNVSLNINDLSIQDVQLENLEWLQVTSDAIELNLPFDKQVNDIVLDISPIKVKGVSGEVDLGTINIKNDRGLLNGITNTGNVDLSDYNVDIEKLSLSFGLNVKTFSKNFQINAQIGKVFSSEINTGIDESQATAIYNNGSFNLSYVGKINEFELKQKNTFLGKLPKGHFELVVSTSKGDIGALVNGYGKYVLYSDPKMHLNTNFTGAITGTNDVKFCITIKCNLSDIAFFYTAEVGGEQATGHSICELKVCDFGGLSHSIKIENTVNFFDMISTSKIISPILLTQLLTVVISGSQIGSGHEVIF